MKRVQEDETYLLPEERLSQEDAAGQQGAKEGAGGEGTKQEGTKEGEGGQEGTKEGADGEGTKQEGAQESADGKEGTKEGAEGVPEGEGAKHTKHDGATEGKERPVRLTRSFLVMDEDVIAAIKKARPELKEIELTRAPFPEELLVPKKTRRLRRLAISESMVSRSTHLMKSCLQKMSVCLSSCVFAYCTRS